MQKKYNNHKLIKGNNQEITYFEHNVANLKSELHDLQKKMTCIINHHKTQAVHNFGAGPRGFPLLEKYRIQ